MKFYPENTMASFRTVLPGNGINLGNSDWEVAVSEVVFPTLLNNVVDGRFRYKISVRDLLVIPVLQITKGLYKTVGDIIKAMRDLLDPFWKTDVPEWDITINPLTKNTNNLTRAWFRIGIHRNRLGKYSWVR